MRRIFSGRTPRSGPSLIAALIALLILHAVLLLPAHPEGIVVRAFFFLPIELPILILLLAAPLPRVGWLLRALIILGLAVFATLKLANVIAFLVFARPFNPVVDAALIPIAVETLAKASVWLVVATVAGLLPLLGAITASFMFAAGVIAAPRNRTAMALVGAVLLTCAVGFHFAPPLRDKAVFDASLFVKDQTQNVVRSLAAVEEFKRDVAADPFRSIPGERLLTRLKGHDVLLIFIEAYGHAALEDPVGLPMTQLAQSQEELRAAGYAMRSAWLTSPTFGGASWLAHGTFVSGLWIDDHQRYNTLFVSDHKTLIHDFTRAGWRTVAVMPLFTRPWPEGRFFGYDHVYAAGNLGYAGPPFGYITMPDQYVLSAFQRLELTAAGRKPVMAEMALNSSHLPWTPRPLFLPWDQVGDGAVFAGAREGSEFDVDWLDADKMREHYMKAAAYALKTVFSFTATLVTDPALVIILGDHQPISVVAGAGAGRDVPIHVLSRDPALLEAFSDWTEGLVPGAQSPVWKMDAMRAHILKSFSADLPS